MAIKKSDLYSHLWETANQLRGGMDASQYKDYVLVILFVKYVTDKYLGKKYADFIIPEGGSFKDMINAKGQKNIGEQINIIIAKLAEANDLKGVIDRTDFDDSEKLGKDKEKVEKLTKLIAIFEHPNLDFSKNKAEGDDILGDVYEYFMKHFASESGKSKGQFYTPAEVSRIMAKIIGVEHAQSADQTAYDMACGSGSLLLKVASEANVDITLYGQEKDIAVSVLAKMNMILHGEPTAEIAQGNTLSDPAFKDGDRLKTFDFCVANPPFSDKGWNTGVNAENDEYHRFDDGIPPEKNGDYAFLSHMLKSLKQTGKGAIVLPHGVLFRGGAEEIIRTNFIKKGYFKAIIGLPANLFYGTGIPACIIVLDKENAVNRKGIFMIDASKGFIKDGNKNKLREQDIHKIVDIFRKQKEIDKYSRMVSFEEIAENEYNLNLPRYINNQEDEDIHDIHAHLQGGIPNTDIQKFQNYWNKFTGLKSELFGAIDDNYSSCRVVTDHIQETISQNSAYQNYSNEVMETAKSWFEDHIQIMKEISSETKIREFITILGESILSAYKPDPLIQSYAVYQHLMDYWGETMQDDLYSLVEDGRVANTYRVIEVNKKTQKETDKGWTCDLLPKEIVIDAYFKEDKKHIEELEEKKETVLREQEEMLEEYGGEEGVLEGEDGKINKTILNASIKEIKGNPSLKEELDIMESYLGLLNKETALNKQIKTLEKKLDDLLLLKYPTLTSSEVQDLVINRKWKVALFSAIQGEEEKVLQNLNQGLQELVERYENTLSDLQAQADLYEAKVAKHLQDMGFTL